MLASNFFSSISRHQDKTKEALCLRASLQMLWNKHLLISHLNPLRKSLYLSLMSLAERISMAEVKMINKRMKYQLILRLALPLLRISGKIAEIL